MLASDMQAQMEDALRQSALAGPLVNWNPFGHHVPIKRF